MRKQAINEQRQRKQRENTLIDHKDNEKQQGNSMENSNEIRPLPTRNEGAASGEGDPNKLYNKNLQMAFDRIGKEIAREVDRNWIKKTNPKFYNYLYGDKC